MAKKAPWILEDLEILNAGSKGMCIAKTDEGKTVLVRNVVPGDVADVRVIKKNKRFLQAKLNKLKKASELRVEPKCEHFGVCGGCKWQNMGYDSQLMFKQQEVKDHMERIAKLPNPEILPIIGSEDIYFYRNKLEFSFSNQRWITDEEINSGKDISNKNALGFHIPGMWSKILDLNNCYLQPDSSNQIRLAVNKFANEHNLSFFDPVNQEGFLRTLMIRNTLEGNFMVLVQFYHEDKEKRELLLNFIGNNFPEVTSLLYTINPKANDTLYDLDIKTFKGDNFLMAKMEDLSFKVGPKSFYQTNPKQAYTLYSLARKLANLNGDEIVYDLYTGTGTIAQFLAKNAKKVVGVESVQEAIDAAHENAERNGIDNCTFYCGDMRKIFTEDFVNQNGKPDVLVTDPPRDGMHPKVVENIIKVSPKRIVYISCNSATQARDLEVLKEHYSVDLIQPVDMFPHTHHVENIVVLSRLL